VRSVVTANTVQKSAKSSSEKKLKRVSSSLSETVSIVWSENAKNMVLLGENNGESITVVPGKKKKRKNRKKNSATSSEQLTESLSADDKEARNNSVEL
jgi:predicted RNase H-like nuclease (RuvC/YqgF family)